MTWKDTTRRFKAEDKHSEPRQWTLVVSNMHNFEVIIYKPEMLVKSTWAMSCYAVHIDGRALESQDTTSAKKEAIGIVYKKLCAMKEKLEAML